MDWIYQRSNEGIGGGYDFTFSKCLILLAL